MLAAAITVAKTNFFMQCSWEFLKIEINTRALAGGMCNRSEFRLCRGAGLNDTTASNAVLKGL
jgi:hypothetical protein